MRTSGLWMLVAILGAATTHAGAYRNVDDDASAWGVYVEGAPTWATENVASPSGRGVSLRAAITGGTPYSNIHVYRNFPSEPDATAFTLKLKFWYAPPTTFNNDGEPSVIQAIEFSMSKWIQEQRFEFAVQWQNVGAGAPQWRYWDPSQSDPWVSLGTAAPLAGEQWHSLTVQGEIVNGDVRYRRLTIDKQKFTLDITVPPAPAPGETDRLAIAIQLDGNSLESPYDVFLDKVKFARKARR